VTILKRNSKMSNPRNSKERFPVFIDTKAHNVTGQTNEETVQVSEPLDL
jgi:hypothetical protein